MSGAGTSGDGGTDAGGAGIQAAANDSAANDGLGNGGAANDSAANDSAANGGLGNGGAPNGVSANGGLGNGGAANDSAANDSAANGGLGNDSPGNDSPGNDGAGHDSAGIPGKGMRRPRPHGAFADAGAALKHDIEERIRTRAWQAGHRLPGERVLAQEYAVSRAVVREVLQSIASQGLIEISPARGAFVRRPDGSVLAGAFSRLLSTHGATVRDVFEARVLLETEVAGRAAARRGAPVAERLAALASAIDEGDDLLDQAISDLRFHSLLCEATGNPVLSAMHRAIAPYVLFMTLRRERRPATSNARHDEILAAVRAGDEALARRLTRVHLDSTREFFAGAFDRPVDEVAAENLRRISGGFWTLDDVVRRAFAELDGQELTQDDARRATPHSTPHPTPGTEHGR
ncbi:FCD domain-containing protein [Streptomyces sp. B6B3]|uniref:FadR/GntR family transcriptional regulator n=1 Tax=Streptomyces sp. B6B3 TaxID=3153570 RepID=UPI00325F08F6